MRRLFSRFADLRREQSGVAVVIVALLMSVLFGMAAFAVDFGWIYWNVIKIQHGADAAALSGVIYEPGSQSLAYQHALEAASENGYQHAPPNSSVVPVDFEQDATAVENANQLRVTVTDTVPTFFMSIFGFDSITISKHAIAEYVLPLAMGSDLPYFGTDPSNPDRQPNFWGNIHGYYTGRSMGDRFSSQCNHAGSTSGCDVNPDARPTASQGTSGGFDDYSGGYIYGIEVEDGFGDLTVEIFDGPFYRDGNDRFLVGDNPQGSGETLQDQGPTTRFMLYAPDPTPLNTADNTLLCSVSFGPEDNFADFDGDGNIGSWDSGANRWRADDDDDQPDAFGVKDGWFDWDDIERAFSNPTIKEVEVPIQGLHPDLDGIKILQLSDLHIGDFLKWEFTESIVERSRPLEPDLIVLTGDMADGMAAYLKRDIEPLGTLYAPLGKYYVNGNHEYFTDLEGWQDLFLDLGYQPLHNDHRILPVGKANLLIAGITDPTAARMDPENKPDLGKALQGAPKVDFKLLLAHQPNLTDNLSGAEVNLQLSGHTHGGQYLPWPIVAFFANNYLEGLSLQESTYIYVSQGAGFWGPPLRLGTEAEITLLRLKSIPAEK